MAPVNSNEHGEWTLYKRTAKPVIIINGDIFHNGQTLKYVIINYSY